MILFLINFKNCEYKYDTLQFDRCRITNSTQWESNEESYTLGLYLHANSKSVVLVTSQNKTKYKIQPGRGIFISNEKANASCVGKDCDISFWFSDVQGENAYVIADSTGVSYSVKDIQLTTSLITYIDFGENSRINVKNITHPKKYPMNLYTTTFANDTMIYNHKNLRSNEILNFSRPAIIEIESAPFIKTSFNYVVGSTYINSKEFAQNGKSIEWDNIVYQMHDIFSQISTQYDMFYFKIGMCVLSSIPFIYSFINMIVVCNCIKPKAKDYRDNDVKTETPLLI